MLLVMGLGPMYPSRGPVELNPSAPSCMGIFLARLLCLEELVERE